MACQASGGEFLQKVTTPLKIFKPVDPLFKELAGISSRTSFISQLTEILEENSILYATEAEETTKETPAAKKKKYEHQKTFFEECIIMREQHPHNQSITFLPTGNQQWRKKCMNVLQYDKEKMGPFGSSFREQIFVAALPTSCFNLVEELDQSFKDGHVRTSFKKTVMTAGVFQCLVGSHSEDKILQILNQLNDGEISLTDFRIKSKELKAEEKEDSAMKEIELVRLRREVQRLKTENSRLTTILMQNNQEKEKEKEKEIVEPEISENVTEVSGPSVGALVMARWSPDKVYYEAKVLSITKRGYAVKYTLDGYERTYPQKYLKPL